jgi:hypothetical protein
MAKIEFDGVRKRVADGTGAVQDQSGQALR